jgi:hypothetical protein
MVENLAGLVIVAADLFAYFISVRYFERPGDAARCTAPIATALPPRRRECPFASP